MAITLKQWQRAGKKAEERARAYMKEHGGKYPAALAAVLQTDAKLREAYYRRSPTQDPLTALTELAAYLNAEAARPAGEASALVEIMIAAKHLGASKAEREQARSALEQQLSNLSVRCVPLFTGGVMSLGLMYPAGHLGTIARALHEGTFSALHCCRWCKEFFVDADHRKTYCSKKCSKARATHRVQEWRRAQRSEEGG